MSRSFRVRVRSDPCWVRSCWVRSEVSNWSNCCLLALISFKLGLGLIGLGLAGLGLNGIELKARRERCTCANNKVYPLLLAVKTGQEVLSTRLAAWPNTHSTANSPLTRVSQR